jgi:NADPH-dependent curcumin reductase
VNAVNTQCRLAARPADLPKATDWSIVDEAKPVAADGEFVVQVDYLSIDPAMRTWMNAGRSYVPPVEIGEVMRALGVGHVVESRHPGFSVGDDVSGIFGVQRYALSNGAEVNKLDTTLAPATTYLGALGISGLTAYFGLLDVGRPEPGQTVLVSGAAGSVGSIVGQIARSTDAEPSVLPGAKTNAAGWSRRSDSTPRSITRAPTCVKSSRRTRPTVSTSISTTSAAQRWRPH